MNRWERFLRSKTKMKKWLQERLSVCLGFEVPDDMVKYIMALKTSEEFDEYFETLLNKDCEDHRLFLADAKRRLFSKALPTKKQSQDAPREQRKPAKQNIASSQQDQQQQQQQQQQSKGAKKKTKFVNLYQNDGSVKGDIILLKGRHHCDCQASEHSLVNNCLSCGRIVCAQEGSGPCLFCGEIVCTNEEQQIMKKGSKKGENLLKSLQEKGGGESLRKALEHRDKLLEYERNSEKRTTVIDDEMDYFQENSVWLNEAERQKLKDLREDLQEQKHASRIGRKFKIDFAGREIDDEQTVNQEYERKILEEAARANASASDSSNWASKLSGLKVTPGTCGIDPRGASIRPVFIKSPESQQSTEGMPAALGMQGTYNRVQDREILEMQDMRQCLSMHQPYASLLVAGIKKHEGRVWYTEHRGRLWIASGAKEAREDEIRNVENFYKNYYNDPYIEFPENYPCGFLLGCVKVEDCLAQEEYRELYPDGESESPYVLICSNPKQLPVVIPIKGQHKIYQIDPKIHTIACKSLLRMNVPKENNIKF